MEAESAKYSAGWHNILQKFHLNLILLAIVHPDGNRAIFSRALLDADFGRLGCGSKAAGAHAKLNYRPKKARPGHKVPRGIHLRLILLAFVHPDGDQTIFSRALLGANFGPVG